MLFGVSVPPGADRRVRGTQRAVRLLLRGALCRLASAVRRLACHAPCGALGARAGCECEADAAAEIGRGAGGALIVTRFDGSGAAGAGVGGAGGGSGGGVGGRVVDARVVGCGVWCGVVRAGARGAAASGWSATAAAGCAGSKPAENP